MRIFLFAVSHRVEAFGKRRCSAISASLKGERSIGNEVAAWLIAIEDAGLFMYVKVLRQAG